jgi:hypothetical protein
MIAFADVTTTFASSTEVDPFDVDESLPYEDMSRAERAVRRLRGVASAEQWLESETGYVLVVKLARDSVELRQQVRFAVRSDAPSMSVRFSAP